MAKLEALAAAVLLVSSARAAQAQDALAASFAREGAAPVPATPQRGQMGPLRGFVYSGRLADGDGPLRWADYPLVSHVYAGSPAEAQGLRAGDSILRVNGRDATDTEAFFGARVGDRWTLTVQRGLEMLEIAFTLVEPTWLLSEWTPPTDTFSTP